MVKESVSILGIRKKTILYHTNFFGTECVCVMEPISEKEETELDDALDLTKTGVYVLNNGTAVVKHDIKLYGAVDLNNLSDLEAINQHCLCDENFRSFVYSNFNYETGEVTLINKKMNYHPTCDNLTWFKHNHCLLGKPKRVIIYTTPKVKL